MKTMIMAENQRLLWQNSAENVSELLKIVFMYFRSPAQSGACLNFEPNCRKCLGWTDHLRYTGLSAERVKRGPVLCEGFIDISNSQRVEGKCRTKKAY